jgi:3-deoxy-7-phosphoheptulonate synthase
MGDFTMEMQMDYIRKLPSPQELMEQFPADTVVQKIKQKRDIEIQRILSGKDKRFLLIIGPCSADNETAVLDYIQRLADVQMQVADKIFIIPRVYTNKPRTIGIGYKGMLHQPDPEGKEDMLAGIIAIREMNAHIVRETGFTCAEEILYPEIYRYLSDLLSYAAVGARSVEDQLHRMIASGVGIPVGMKNPTSGDISVMLNSIEAAQHSQEFLFRGWEVRTKGNPMAHAILRGYVDKFGNNMPNYHYEDLQGLLEAYHERGLENPAVIIDTNHSNSGKKYLEQIRIAKDVLHSRNMSKEVAQLVKGLMIESYIEDGCQKISEGTYGKSITDPCLGWDKTEQLILELADLL